MSGVDTQLEMQSWLSLFCFTDPGILTLPDTVCNMQKKDPMLSVVTCNSYSYTAQCPIVILTMDSHRSSHIH